MTDSKKKNKVSALLWLLMSAAIVALDQWTKCLSVSYIKGGESVVVIPHVFRFTYVENRGAAFGILSGHRWIFMLFTVIAVAAMILYLLKFSEENALLRCALSMIIGGGIGNMIDRAALRYVVDFIDFYAFPQVWNWVFNAADSFVCIGAGLLVLYCILTLVKEGKAARANEAESADATPGDGDTRGGES